MKMPYTVFRQNFMQPQIHTYIALWNRHLVHIDNLPNNLLICMWPRFIECSLYKWSFVFIEQAFALRQSIFASFVYFRYQLDNTVAVHTLLDSTVNYGDFGSSGSSRLASWHIDLCLHNLSVSYDCSLYMLTELTIPHFSST